MKTFHRIFTVILVAVVFMSCNKNIDLENETLIGKWKLVKVFKEYENSGTFSWNYSTSPKEIQFLSNGEFTETFNDGKVNECMGTYEVFSGNKMKINSSCGKTTETLVISEQYRSNLVIDRQLTDGVIRERYIRVGNR